MNTTCEEFQTDVGMAPRCWLVNRILKAVSLANSESEWVFPETGSMRANNLKISSSPSPDCPNNVHASGVTRRISPPIW